jgi:hypothetical protein
MGWLIVVFVGGTWFGMFVATLLCSAKRGDAAEIERF